MKSINALLVIALSFAFIGCKQQASPVAVTEQGPSKVFTKAQAETEQLPYAEINMPKKVNMGIFEGSELKKTTTIKTGNIGTDTLYLRGAQAECECTEHQLRDSVVPPHSSTSIEVTLDLSDYPNDTIYKTFGVISNSRTGNVTRCDVFGVRK